MSRPTPLKTWVLVFPLKVDRFRPNGPVVLPGKWMRTTHGISKSGHAPCAEGAIFTYVECVRTVLDTWQDGAEVETEDEVSSLLQRLIDHDACDI